MNKRIVLSGIDGSGKSSHVCYVKKVAEKNGVNIKTMWARRYVISLPILAICRLLGITNVYKNKNGYRVSEYPFYRYNPLRLIWPWVQLFDWLLFYAYLELFSVFSNSCFLFDRFTIDAFVDILSDVKKPVGKQLLETLFLSALTRDLCVIILDVDENVSIERKKDVSSFCYLSSRRKIYKDLAKKFNWPVISTNASFVEVQSAIWKIITKRGLIV